MHGDRVGWPYVLLCLIVPLVWGVVSARLFDWWQTRFPPKTAKPPNEADTDMYYI